MISINGKWYDSKTSAQMEAVCHIYDNGTVKVESRPDGEPLLTLPKFDIDVSARLANTPRNFYFPAGEKFETEENDAVDQLMKKFKRQSWLTTVYRLESRNCYIFIALLILILFMWASMRYGVPQTAKLLAHQLPPATLHLAGRQTLALMDRAVFRPSELDEAVQNRLKKHFGPVIADHPGYDLKILFRKGGRLGPNAFALPNGAIIFTDEMVRLAENDNELSAVLSHEIGHIVHRHALRSVIQDSFLAFALLAITGDISGSSELFLGLPVLLTELAYSREFEREADRYALDYLKSHDIAPLHFVRLMRRIDQKKPSGLKNLDGKWSHYLSTHPVTEKRFRKFEQNEY